MKKNRGDVIDNYFELLKVEQEVPTVQGRAEEDWIIGFYIPQSRSAVVDITDAKVGEEVEIVIVGRVSSITDSMDSKSVSISVDSMDIMPRHY